MQDVLNCKVSNRIIKYTNNFFSEAWSALHRLFIWIELTLVDFKFCRNQQQYWQSVTKLAISDNWRLATVVGHITNFVADRQFCCWSESEPHIQHNEIRTTSSDHGPTIFVSILERLHIPYKNGWSRRSTKNLIFYSFAKFKKFATPAKATRSIPFAIVAICCIFLFYNLLLK